MTNRKSNSRRSGSRHFRPPAIDDYVRRERLESMLEHGQERPIVVVCAPAGYGKSTQISQWVNQQGLPCAWISLDSSHNELGTFLRHLAEGVKGWSPNAAEFLHKVLTSSEPPSANHIADIFSTKTDDASDEFILVFDDYHNVTDAAIHLFIESMLMHMPDLLRVAIVSRRTPPIALSRLRSRNLVLDLRLQDLQFDRGATRDLVRTASGIEVDEALLGKLEDITEGWPAGLRMLLLALAGHKDVRKYLMQYEGSIWQIQEYLVEEVLRQLPDSAAEHIATTAILDRFSAELCEALISSDSDDAFSGVQLIELIRNKGLFCVPLDERGEWFRYHHLFRQLLLHQLQSQFGIAEIKQLHQRAAKWLDDEGEPEEAIKHFLESGNADLASAVVMRHKSELIINHQWRRLDRAINMLPTEIIESSVQLQVLLSWTSIRVGRLTRVFELAQMAADLFDDENCNDAPDNVTLGQISALQAAIKYHNGDGRAALASAEKALELLPSRHVFERAEATMMRGVSLQMLGDVAGGRKVLFDSLEHPECELAIFRARVLAGLCYLSWQNSDLQRLLHYANNLLKLGQSHDDEHAIVHACWFGGAALYQLDNLEDGADFVRQICESNWWPHQRSYIFCMEIMSLIHAARGEHAQASKLCEALINQSMEARSTFHLPEIYALQAELAVARGDRVAAEQWAIDFALSPASAAYGHSVPALIAVRILLHSEIPEASEKANAILDEHQAFYEANNSLRFLIETLALQAIRYSKAGDEKTANQLLGRAVALAEPSGFIRIFIDLGPILVPILNRLDLNNRQLKYVGAILAGFQGDSEKQQSDRVPGNTDHERAGLLEALSKRENEVLELLAKRLTNKEIGERLFIAPETVKRHAHNIFEKLNVNDRRAARTKAIGLGLVSD